MELLLLHLLLLHRIPLLNRSPQHLHFSQQQDLTRKAMEQWSRQVFPLLHLLPLLHPVLKALMTTLSKLTWHPKRNSQRKKSLMTSLRKYLSREEGKGKHLLYSPPAPRTSAKTDLQKEAEAALKELSFDYG